MKIYDKKGLNDYQQSLTYDDISLIPIQISRVRSRTEASTNCSFLGLDLLLPVVSSPMDTVTGLEMAKELGKLGCLGILNRFDSSFDDVIKNHINDGSVKAVSIALNTGDDVIERLLEHQKIICIDTANANNNAVLNKTEEIKKKYNIKLIDGSTTRTPPAQPGTVRGPRHFCRRGAIASTCRWPCTIMTITTPQGYLWGVLLSQ